MKGHLGRNLVVLALALLAGAVLWLRTEDAGDRSCALARARLPKLLGLEVGLGKCRLDPLGGGIEVRGFSLTSPGAEEPLLAADRVLLRLHLLEALSGRVRIERVEVDRPRVQVDLTASSSKRSEPGHGCFLDSLHRLEVDSLSINGARVQLRAPEQRSVRLEDLDLELRMSSRGYSGQLSVVRGEVGTGQLTVPLTRLRLSAGLDPVEQRLVLNRLELGAAELALIARGDVDTLCDPSFALDVSASAPLELIASLLGPRAPRMSGAASLTAKLEGTPADPSIEGELTLSHAQVDAFEPGDVWLAARYERGQIRADRLEVAVGPGAVRAKGTVTLGGSFPVQASAELTNVELGRVLEKFTLKHAWPTFAANGRLEVTGQLKPFHLAGPAQLEVRDFRVYDRGWDKPNRNTMLQFDKASVELQADFDAERARLSRGVVRTERSEARADATLGFDPKKGLDIEVRAEEIDLADLGHIVQIPWAGRISGSGRIYGPYEDIAITASVTGREARFHKLNLGSIEGLVDFRRGTLRFPSVIAQKGRSRFIARGELEFGPENGPIGRGTASFTKARLSDLVEATGEEYWLIDLLRHKMEAEIDGDAETDGPVMAPRARVTLALSDTTYLGRKLGEGHFNFTARDAEVVTVDPLTFDGPCGHIRFGGQVSLLEGGELDFKFEAPDLSVAEWFKPDGEWLHGSGNLAVRGRLFGPPSHSRMEGTVQASQIALFDVPLGDGTWALQVDRTAASLKGPLGTDLLLDGRMLLEGELPFALGLDATTNDLGHYLPSVAGLRGSLTGELFAAGSVDRYRETRGDISVSALSFTKGDFSAQSDGPVELAFEGTALELKRGALKGPNGTRLSATGLREADGGLDLTVEGTFDARLVESFTPYVEQAGGRVQVSASIAGPQDRPTVVGWADVDDARFAVRGWPVSARGVRGRAEFSQNKIYLADVDGTVNGGRTVVSGEIDLKDLSAQRLDLRFQMDSVSYRYDEVPTVFSGIAELTGPPNNLLLSGDVDLVRLRYTRDVDLFSLVDEFKRRPLEARSFEKKDEWLRYDMNVRVLPDARIENNLMRAALAGKVTVVGTNAHFGLLGTLTAQEGARGSFRGNEFALTRASVDFTERDRIAPVIDLHAETTVREYKVGVHAWGPADDPQVELHSDPQLARSDVVMLLTLGLTSKDAGSYGTAGAGYGLMGEALLNISGLDKVAKRLQNPVLRDLSFHVSTQYSQATMAVEPTAVAEFRVISDALKLRLTQPVTSARGRKAQLEFLLTDHISAQSQWEESADTPLGSDLGFDLKLQWESD